MHSMAIDRRTFTASLAALGLGGFLPLPVRSELRTGYLSTGFDTLTGHHLVSRLDQQLDIVWDLPLPARGHATTIRPGGSEALVVARRPGSYAVVFDLEDGTRRHTLTPVAGRHFYGHGVYSADGGTLWMTENSFETGDGMIGVYDTVRGYAPIAAFPSGGIGPHQLAMLGDGRTLVVAIGGISTHPDSGRTKLNLETMQPSLVYMDAATGRILEQVHFEDPARHTLSIRHLAVMADDAVAFACQDQTEGGEQAPLVFTHRMGSAMAFRQLPMPGSVLRQMAGYCGSVAYDPAGAVLAVSAPRGGQVAFWKMPEGRWLESFAIKDGCGVAQAKDHPGFVLSNGEGLLVETAENRAPLHQQRHPFRRWDNHLTAILS
jgi:uncharacterized protein